MALVIPPGFTHVVVSITRDGDPDPYAITFGCVTPSGGWESGDLIAMDTALANLADLLCTQEDIVGYTLTVGQDGGDPVLIENPISIPGTDTDVDRLTQNTAVLVAKVTGLGGRKNRGRLYWPSIADNTTNNVGTIDSATVTAYQSSFNDFLDDLATATGVTPPATGMVILHNDVSLPVPDPTPVTSLAVRSVVATQRRRLRR